MLIQSNLYCFFSIFSVKYMINFSFQNFFQIPGIVNIIFY